MVGFNISSFFSNSSNSLGSFNFSDYSLIRSGSYKKLMKSYYAQQDTTKTAKTDNTKTTKKKSEVTDSTGLTQMKKEADGLKEAAEKLSDGDTFKQKNGAYDMEKIVSAVKTFASEYNDTIAQADKVNSRDVSLQTGFMTSLSKTMSGSLAKVGVTVGNDGKLSVNEDTLKKADMKNVKALFDGQYSYASQVENKASAISSAANRSQSMYSSNGTLTNSYVSNYNFWM